MRHLFIVNPVAGGKRNRHKEVVEYIRAVMSKHPESFEIYVTSAPMDACGKIRLEAENCAPLRVYACGGDGTLNECVNGAAGFSHVAVTPYPIGTGNDFVKMFGKDAKKFRSLPALLQGFERPIDLIDCNGRYGINICSIGIDARIGTDVHKYSAIPVIGGATGYVVSLVVNLVRGVNQPLKITAENMHLESSFALVCACNGRYYGGGFNPVPDAMPDDGVIEFLIVRAVSRLKFLRVVGKYAKGRFREMSEIISHFRGNHMFIESEKELAVNIDGELLYARDVTFRMIPGGVNVIFPPGMKFFDSSDVPFAVKLSNLEI
ncbi:lipid kinase, YegS/Rv2252/BmrU family [Sporobacter termitidis DSM 10068]|uniref:Lipid kinase, YegS/Rv2252/BmrU family n=1 Tax=Sporobacter termitidis DSM 10068 TaxID=1123282 RepID=A0A1M5U4K9_9FIRM|nr:YegS/Rv2252/BmrU family lipid kinase [Sporobacter termitidis]SHH57801.1 lipid kinase, YegS/Rv2252/BmrU family [Sporobacter termitidis DSM 10068]